MIGGRGGVRQRQARANALLVQSELANYMVTFDMYFMEWLWCGCGLCE